MTELIMSRAIAEGVREAERRERRDATAMVCPHCDHRNRDEGGLVAAEECEGGEVVCEACEKTFDAWIEYQPCYVTYAEVGAAKK